MINLTPEQLTAKNIILKALEPKNGVSLLTGFAGTGKTTLVIDLVKTLQQAGLPVTIGTPTHKAASVCREMLAKSKLRCEVETIHKIFGMRVLHSHDGKHKLTPPCKRHQGVLIVDESSMLNDDIYRSILGHSERVLFVGDPAQLPPVETDKDKIELSPVFSDIQDHAHLSKVVRQAEGNPIICLATWIRELIESEKKLKLTDFIKKAKQLDPDETKIAIYPLSHLPAIVSGAMTEGMDSRMIGYKNSTTADAAKAIKIEHTGKTDQFGPGDPIYFAQPKLKFDEDETIVQVENNAEGFVLTASEPQIDPVTGLQYQEVNLNELGVFKAACDISAYRELIKKTHEQYSVISIRVKFGMSPDEAKELEEKNKQLSKYIAENYADIRINHALTIHKSQGSTFDCVALDLEDIFKMREHLLRGLYVAVTRPSEYLILCVEE